jgi:hypothetical protein
MIVRRRRCRDEYYFSLVTDSNKPGCLKTVDIIATDQETYRAWVDGIKILASECDDIVFF